MGQLRPEDGPRQPDLTYVGSFDDKVQQYPWQFKPTLQVLNEQLVTYALFGNPLLLNDGYFTSNPQIHRSLLDGPESIIGALAQEGFIKLYIRDPNKDLISGIEASASKGVADQSANLNDEEWTKNVRPFLEGWLPKISWASETWPTQDEANVGRAFYNLLKSRIDSSDLQLPIGSGILHGAFQQFDQDIDKHTFYAARTVWERESIPAFLDNLEGDHDPAVLTSSLMVLANEAYHIAQTAAASRKFGDRTCRVQTALSTAFSDLIDTDDVPLDFDKRQERAKQFVFSEPKNVRITGSGLRALMFPQAGIGLLKKVYLDCFDAFLMGTKGERELQEVFETYRDALADHLSHYEQVGDLKSGFVGYGLSTSLGLIPSVGWMLGAASSVGSATIFRWYRKNLIAGQLERARIEEIQNIPQAFRRGAPWRQSLMSVKLKNMERYLSD